MYKQLILLGILFICAPLVVWALPGYENQIPNGAVDMCLSCHATQQGGTHTPFADDFAANNHLWDAVLAAIDSDNDGYSNGVELQDSTGTWSIGDPDPGNPAEVTNPGDPASFPGATGGPLISNTTQLPDTEDENGPYEVQTTVLDESGVESVSLFYSIDGGVNFTEVAMTEVPAVSFIPPVHETRFDWGLRDDDEDESHRPGEDCGACHYDGGPGEDEFAFGGTIYDDLNGSNVVPGAIITIEDNAGHTYTLTSSQLYGNIWLEVDDDDPTPQPPYTASLSYNGETFDMISTFSNGSCNTSGCHVDGMRIYATPQGGGGGGGGGSDPVTYTADIPGQALGTTVDYYVAAIAGDGERATDPGGAPNNTYRFNVGQPTNTVVRVDPSWQQTSEGMPFVTHIVIDDVNNLGAFDLDVTFNAALVQVDSVELGDFLGSTGRTVSPLGPVVDNTAGRLDFGAYSYGDNAGPSGAGILGVIYWTSLGMGTANITFDNVQVGNIHGVSIPTRIANGSVSIVEQPYPFDPDNDGEVDALDIQLVADRWNTCSGEVGYVPAYDFDENGCIDVLDLQIIASHWGETSPFPEEIPSTGTPTGVHEIQVSLANYNRSVSAGEVLAIDVQVDNVSYAEGLGAYQFDVRYAPEQLELRQIEQRGFLGKSGRYVADIEATIEAGQTRYAAFSYGAGGAVTGGGVIATLEFYVKQSGTALVEIDNIKLADPKGVELPAVETTPQHYTLLQNYPNPFNPKTTIRYTLPVETHATLSIYNLKGQLIRVLVDQPQAADHYAVEWNGTNSAGTPVPSGVYLYHLDAGEFTETRPMVLLK